MIRGVVTMNSKYIREAFDTDKLRVEEAKTEDISVLHIVNRRKASEA